jgi:hypothetical protein
MPDRWAGKPRPSVQAERPPKGDRHRQCPFSERETGRAQTGSRLAKLATLCQEDGLPNSKKGANRGLAREFETRPIREFALPSPAPCPVPARLP